MADDPSDPSPATHRSRFRPTNPPQGGHRFGRSHVIIASLFIAALWPTLFVLQYGGVSALLVASKGGPSYPVIHEDFPDAVLFPAPGHDGQQFYAIARDPVHPGKTAAYLDRAGRRYERIVFPILAWAISPGPGTPLVLGLVLVSLAGVLIGSLALARFPAAPWWLPLTLPLSPGIIVALSMTLGDALATGLVLAAFSMAFRRRWLATTAILVVAALTRETTIVAALCIACWPAIDWRTRMKIAAPPCIALAAWSALASSLVDSHRELTSGGEFALPFTGWFPLPGGVDFFLPAILTLVLASASCRRRVSTPIRLYLFATVVLMACLGPVINFSWVNSTRVLAPALPMAIWVLVRKRRDESGRAGRGTGGAPWSPSPNRSEAATGCSRSGEPNFPDASRPDGRP